MSGPVSANSSSSDVHNSKLPNVGIKKNKLLSVDQQQNVYQDSYQLRSKAAKNRKSIDLKDFDNAIEYAQPDQLS